KGGYQMSRKLLGKEAEIADRLHHKGIFCISPGWFKWAKQYLNRVNRRKQKQGYAHDGERQEDYES
ncbi:MAG: hypothetical protein Q8873_00690, partial [Bacillota bacterium]|nr:hypothetical protein [Bacillota bacterium]